MFGYDGRFQKQAQYLLALPIKRWSLFLYLESKQALWFDLAYRMCQK